MTDMKIIIASKNYSSWSLRGWLAVRLSGHGFKEVVLTLDTPEFHEEIKQYNPTNCVPVLHHGDVVVWDSLAIIDYIDRLCPDVNFWPNDIAAYGFARAISAEMHSSFPTLRSATPMNIRKTYTGLAMSKALAKDVARIDAIWSEARSKFGADGGFLFGDFSAADIMYAPVVHRFKSYGLPRSDISQAYMDAMLGHPAMQEWAHSAMQETEVLEREELEPGTTMLGN